jgi:hypothetical protein
MQLRLETVNMDALSLSCVVFVWARVCLAVCAGFADLLSVKEESEILNAKKAAFLASKVMQAWVVEKIEDIIDKNKKVKHLKLSGEEGSGDFVILRVGPAFTARLRFAVRYASWFRPGCTALRCAM